MSEHTTEPVQPLTPVPIRECPRCGYKTHVKNEDEEFDLILQDNAEKALEIDELEQQRDDLLSALDRLSFAAECRDNTTGDPCRLIQVKAELAAATEHARAVAAKVKP